MTLENTFKKAYVIHTGKKEHILRFIADKNIKQEKVIKKNVFIGNNSLESIVIKNNLPHEIFSNPVPEKHVKDIINELNKRFKEEGVKDKIRLDVHWHDSKTRIISASGSHDIDILLKDTLTWDSIDSRKQLFVCKKLGRKGKKTTSGDMHSLNSPTKYLRQRYPFGTIVNINNDGDVWWPRPSQYPKKVSIDYLLNEPWAAWDLEFWHQLETQYEKDFVVFSAPYFTNSSFGNQILTYLDVGVDKIKFGDFLISNYEPKIKEFVEYIKKSKILNKNFLDFIIKKIDAPITNEFGKIEYEHNPLFLFGHNINNDKKILKKIGQYFPSVGGKHVINKAHILHQKEVTAGRETIDTYQLIYQKGLGMTESLESELIRMNIPFLKGLNLHGILHHLYTTLNETKSKKLRQKSARIITEYAIIDSYVSAILGRYKLKGLLLKSYMFQTSPSDVCLKKVEKLAEEKEARTRLIVDKFHDNNLQKNREIIYKKTTNFEKIRDKQLFETKWKENNKDIETSESMLRKIILWGLGSNENKKNKIKGTFKKGVFKDCYVAYLSPFVGTLKKEILKRDFSYDKIFSELKTTKDPIEKYYLIKAINQSLSHTIRLIKNLKNVDNNNNNNKSVHYFKKRYGDHNVPSPKELHDFLLSNLDPKNNKNIYNIFYLINNSNFIGFSRHGIAYFQPNSNSDLEQNLKKLEKENFISILGKGNVLSFNQTIIDENNVKKEIGGLISLEGINPTYQDIVFRKNTYTLYERSFLGEFLKYSLSNPRNSDEIHKLIKKGIDDIVADKKYNENEIILNPYGSEHLFKKMRKKKERELYPEKTGYYGILIGETKNKHSEDFKFLKNIDKIDVEYYKKHFYTIIVPFAKEFLTEDQLWDLKNHAYNTQLSLF